MACAQIQQQIVGALSANGLTHNPSSTTGLKKLGYAVQRNLHPQLQENCVKHIIQSIQNSNPSNNEIRGVNVCEEEKFFIVTWYQQ